jgi:D-glycero-alpha-D-manno-heptose-7-phosphate kinase
MQLELFTIINHATIKDAMRAIESNQNGFVLVVDKNGVVEGVVTDGDIRRKLLTKVTLNDGIETCTNYDFVWAEKDTPREILLKQLDHKIRAIPILDSNKKLISIVTKDYIPEKSEMPVFSRAKAPVRISFGGGGSDISSYFSENGGAVINATISLYSHASLKVRDDSKILINSLDLNSSIEFENIEELYNHKGKFLLIQSVIKAIKPNFGFELYLHSDFPMNSGLGGSAVVSAAILGCFNQFRNDKWDLYDISEIAYQAERLYLNVAGGWQDQYAAVFGGFNFMEFNQDQNLIHPIKIPKEVLLELGESLVLCYTGTTHDSGNIHDDQREQTKSFNVKERIQANVDLTYKMRNHLLRGRLNELGVCLNTAWQLKKSFSNKISNPLLDKIYDGALANGAIGGKLLGAGGGGYFLFYVPAFSRLKLMKWVEKENLIYTPFKFEESGLQSWTVRVPK